MAGEKLEKIKKKRNRSAKNLSEPFKKSASRQNHVINKSVDVAFLPDISYFQIVLRFKCQIMCVWRFSTCCFQDTFSQESALCELSPLNALPSHDAFIISSFCKFRCATKAPGGQSCLFL